MSYLLEALKKSDKERQRGAIPDLQTDHSRPSVRKRRQRASSWYLSGITVLVLLCGGGLVWWQYSPQGAQTDKSLPETVELLVEEEVPRPIPVAKVSPPRVVVAAKTESVVEEKEAIPKANAAFVPPLLDELPVAIRAAIPDLSFAGHVYSDVPQKRLIIINNRIVREGDLVGDGLTLEKIDYEGVVLRYESSVFRVDLF